MFNTKNSSPEKESFSQKIKLSASFDLEKIPVRTMKKDLEQLSIDKREKISPENSPDKTAIASNFPPEEEKEIKPQFQNIPPRAEKTPLSVSPFLTKKDISSAHYKETSKKELPRETLEKHPEAETAKETLSSSEPFSIDQVIRDRINLKKETLLIKETSGKTKTSWGKVFFSAILLFILLLTGFLGYYYWTNRELPIPAKWFSKFNDFVQFGQFATQSPPLASPTPEIHETASFSEKNPNYLSIDLNNPGNEQIKSVLQKYAQKVTASKTSLPIEFIPTDNQNNPISFSLFSKKLGLSLSQDLLSAISDESFSLFFYNDTQKAKIGLSIPLRQGTRLKSVLLQEESNLARELEPIFLISTYTIENKLFSESNYKGIEVRYLNILSPEELSIDYAIQDNHLLIGTTKMTLRSIMDYSNEPTSVPNPPTSESSPMHPAVAK